MGAMNTKVIEAEYDYVKPASLDEALDILAEKENVKIYAGGTDLLVKLKMGADLGMDIMMDINGIEDLYGVDKTADGGLRIGAAEKIWNLETNADVIAMYPILSEAMHLMASVSVRNMATIGGNFCNASPVADTVGPCMCYGACVELKSKKGVRTVDATEFFLKPGVTVMEADEILTAIILPAPEENTGAAFTKMARVRPDIAKVSISCVIKRDGDAIKDCRMAMGSVAPKPLFLGDISAELAGKKMSAALIEETAQKVHDFVKPIGDHGTTAEYRKEMAHLIAKEILEKAWENSGGELA
jgi:carbon-monoxide dehydrogenase medium subunit